MACAKHPVCEWEPEAREQETDELCPAVVTVHNQELNREGYAKDDQIGANKGAKAGRDDTAVGSSREVGV